MFEKIKKTYLQNKAKLSFGFRKVLKNYAKFKYTSFELSAYGYAPYTQKLIDDHVPAFITPLTMIGPTKYGAAYTYTPFHPNGKPTILIAQSFVTGSQDDRLSLLQNQSYIEHEGVHHDQRKNSEIKYSFLFQPDSYVALEKLLEFEAYTRQYYAVLHNFKNNLLNADDIKNQHLSIHLSKEHKGDYRVSESPLGSVLETVTKTKRRITTSDDLDANLRVLKQQSYMPDEKEVLAKSFLSMCRKRTLTNALTEAAITTSASLVSSVQEIKSMSYAFDTDYLFNATGYSVNDNLFGQELTLDTMSRVINREETNYFANISKSEKEFLLANLYSKGHDQYDAQYNERHVRQLNQKVKKLGYN